MKELIEALQILLKYGDVKYPFHCEQDKLHIVGYDPSKFSDEDITQLRALGFNISIEGKPFDPDDPDNISYEDEISSYKYGSA